ncbi:hypothetical protein BDZ89DRAFT_211638 [Hymenopellis radicata]|nr:hypothetical protein BDZ89DRAFT_211638 [Hymenopellis radicata]
MQPCPKGTYRAGRAYTTCGELRSEHFIFLSMESSASRAVPCLPATYPCSAGSTKCTKASSGVSAPGFGSGAQTQCLLRTLSDNEGSVSCDACPSWMFARQVDISRNRI